MRRRCRGGGSLKRVQNCRGGGSPRRVQKCRWAGGGSPKQVRKCRGWDQRNRCKNVGGGQSSDVAIIADNRLSIAERLRLR